MSLCLTPGVRRENNDALPLLEPEVLVHGERVLAFLREQIAQAGGALDFAEFMRLALYAPDLGYYAAGMAKFGAAGDFVTAPEISPLFARSMARQVAEVLTDVLAGLGQDADVLEFGAGSGSLAVELLLALEALQCLPKRYLILEVSASLRIVQRERLARLAPHVQARVVWLDAWPQDFVGVMLGNEVLDAMPVRILEVTAGEPLRLAVSDSALGLAWATLPASEEDVRVLTELAAARGEAFAEGYRVEFHPDLQGWVRGVAQSLKQGVVLLLDYGAAAVELYAPERWMGTLRCHVRHHAHNDPLIYPGLQDITAWVDFSRLARCAKASGLDVLGYTMQAHFLLGCGLAAVYEDAFAHAEREVDRLQLAQGFKTLMMPGEMGERFKVMALGRGVAADLSGFGVRDFRGRL
ncbi:MAG: class I SAM-dependent methyltransferase [Halothiobacillaceae bacterium]